MSATPPDLHRVEPSRHIAISCSIWSFSVPGVKKKLNNEILSFKLALAASYCVGIWWKHNKEVRFSRFITSNRLKIFVGRNKGCFDNQQSDLNRFDCYADIIQ